MNYDQRMATLKLWFKEQIATRFTMPSGVDPKIAITDTLDAVNTHLPANLTPEQMGHLVATIAKEVARSARSRTLPQPKDFITAAAIASRSHGEGGWSGAKGSDGSTYLDKIAARVAAGESIPQSWLSGQRRRDLLTKVQPEALEPYDRTVSSWGHQYWD